MNTATDTAWVPHLPAFLENAQPSVLETRSLEMVQRIERIRGLQREAVYPLNTVGMTLAQSQLAQVEVPWLVARLEEAALIIRELEEL